MKAWDKQDPIDEQEIELNKDDYQKLLKISSYNKLDKKAYAKFVIKKQEIKLIKI